ncbi:MAG TPA: hypothetical protein VLM78_03260 [Anaerolineales bacterium]|nr:hypothetical protein [Anaerolineales bacterium]
MAYLTGTNLLSLLLATAAFFFFIAGVRALRLGSRTIYFRHRRQRVLAGWWMTGASLLLAVVAALMFRPKNPLFVPAPLSATTVALASHTPAATPSRTSSPAPRPSRAVTFTATASPTATPHLPLSLEIMVLSSVTPQASATIGDIRFSDVLDDGYPIGNRFEWSNPLSRMYVSYAYSRMTYGAQFTALWFRNGELVFFESGPWQAGGHGGASLKWEPAPHEWHPGEYEVQFFVGTEWKATGRFTLTGEPLPPTFTPTLTFTPSPTWTPSLVPSETPTLTGTPSATPSRTPSPTPQK